MVVRYGRKHDLSDWFELAAIITLYTLGVLSVIGVWAIIIYGLITLAGWAF